MQKKRALHRTAGAWNQMKTWKGQQGRWRVNPVWEAGKEEVWERRRSGQIQGASEAGGGEEWQTGRPLPCYG